MGGGVAIAISLNCTYKRRTDLELELSELEICIVELVTKSTNVLVASLYRPPNGDENAFLSHYSKLLKLLKAETNKEILIGLDHNLDFLKASLHCKTQDFIDLNVDSEMWPVITKPT